MKTGLLLLGFLLASGCSFNPPAVESDGDQDAGGGTPDAPAGGGDGAAVDGPPECWSVEPAHFDSCTVPTPMGALDLDQSGTYLYNTDTGTLTAPGGATIAHQSIELINVQQNARLVSVTQLDVRGQVTLRAHGQLPLIVASEGNIVIHDNGRIDVSSRRSGPLPIGAGANPSLCASHQAQPGQNLAGGGSGGGGGGFQGKGGDGGDGNSGASTGGSGGATVTPPDVVRGGCAGGNGGDGNSQNSGGAGGAGGGAVQLTAQGSITVLGILHAGGAGGTGANAGQDAGAGAGGSGGYVGLDAPSITIRPGATLAANGGSGGEGSNNAGVNLPGNGSDASASAQPAPRSSDGAPNASEGQVGSAGANLEGVSVTDVPGGGGGGGGGGAGYILSFGAPTVQGNPVRSPAITIMP